MANALERKNAAELFTDTWEEMKHCLPGNLLFWMRQKNLQGFEKWKRDQESSTHEQELRRWLADNTGDIWFKNDLNHLIAGGQELLQLIYEKESYSTRRGVHMERARGELRKIGGMSRILFTTFLKCPWVPVSYKAFLCACSLEEMEDEYPHEIATTLQGGTFINIVGAGRTTGLGGTVRTNEGVSLEI